MYQNKACKQNYITTHVHHIVILTLTIQILVDCLVCSLTVSSSHLNNIVLT